MVPLPPGEAVLVDELGSAVIETLPAAEQAVVLELCGELVRSGGERFTGKFLMSPGQVGELIADLVASLSKSGVDVMKLVKAELVEALARESNRQAAEGAVERASEAAQRHGPPVVVHLEGDPAGGVAHVFEPFPHEDYGGAFCCRVEFKGGGPLDGNVGIAPVAVACAAFAVMNPGGITVDETPEGDE